MKNSSSNIRGKVCAFCGKYQIWDLHAFIKHLKKCNPAMYERLTRLLCSNGP